MSSESLFFNGIEIKLFFFLGCDYSVFCSYLDYKALVGVLFYAFMLISHKWDLLGCLLRIQGGCSFTATSTDTPVINSTNVIKCIRSDTLALDYFWFNFLKWDNLPNGPLQVKCEELGLFYQLGKGICTIKAKWLNKMKMWPCNPVYVSKC